MGIVYRARQKSLAREVAVKAVRHEALANRERLRAFAAEARVTAMLDHPNIVSIYALGYGGAGQPLLAMKRVQGRSWRTLLVDDPPASSLEALHRHIGIFEKALDAVAFAHSRGIIHRDLKPDNVMVGAFGQVFVLDWGLALDVGVDPEAGRGTIPNLPSQAGACGTRVQLLDGPRGDARLHGPRDGPGRLAARADR
jgi:serine/threonine-protein kinase